MRQIFTSVKTGELVLCHDARIDGVSDGTGRLDEMTLEELRQFDFGKGQRIMILDELLELTAGHCRLNLELKGTGSGRAAAAILAYYLD